MAQPTSPFGIAISPEINPTSAGGLAPAANRVPFRRAFSFALEPEHRSGWTPWQLRAGANCAKHPVTGQEAGSGQSRLHGQRVFVHFVIARGEFHSAATTWGAQTARTSPAPDSGLSKACRTIASVSLGFSSAVCSTRGSASSSNAAATRPDARRAKDRRAPEAMDSRRLSRVSSAATLMSPAITGVRATCMRSKVNSCRRSDNETWRGVLGCPTKASLTFRPVAALLLPSRSRTSDGRSILCSRARARSSLKAGSAAAAWSVSVEELPIASSSEAAGLESVPWEREAPAGIGSERSTFGRGSLSLDTTEITRLSPPRPENHWSSSGRRSRSLASQL